MPLFRARRRAGYWLIGLGTAAALGAVPPQAAAAAGPRPSSASTHDAGPQSFNQNPRAVSPASAHYAGTQSSNQNPHAASPASAHNGGTPANDQNPHSTSPSAPSGSGAPSSSFPGYRIVSTTGLVGTYGEPFVASLEARSLQSSVVGIAGTPDGAGYWLVAGDGGVFAFGDAVFHGSLSGQSLQRDVVGIAATPDGGGYWEVGADGGVFAFGDAGFLGSLGSARLHAPVVSIAATPDGRGYWLVAADGGVFAFGDAGFFGSASGVGLNQRVADFAASPDGEGYWLVSRDGGVFAFGDARYLGSASQTSLASPVVAIAATPDGSGYWMVAGDGGIFAFGDAPFRGGASGSVPSGQSVVGISAGPGTRNDGTNGDFSKAASAARSYPSGAQGFDVSWPQCAAPLPAPSTIAVVGINDGTANTFNPCFRAEASWAGLNLSVYVNLNAPDPAVPSQWAQGPAGTCAPGDVRCASYNFGFNSTRGSINTVRAEGFEPHLWLLDVETSNLWSADPGTNAQVVAGALDAVARADGRAAIYSTTLQWNDIVGNYRPGVPAWYATGAPLSSPQQWCGRSFTGGPVYLVQGLAGPFDSDYAC
jgi:hypothetical protein